jgi:hypothetical protein
MAEVGVTDDNQTQVWLGRTAATAISSLSTSFEVSSLKIRLPPAKLLVLLRKKALASLQFSLGKVAFPPHRQQNVTCPTRFRHGPHANHLGSSANHLGFHADNPVLT